MQDSPEKATTRLLEEDYRGTTADYLPIAPHLCAVDALIVVSDDAGVPASLAGAG